ncbi:hypothetical protein FQN50_000200 [Emmonsiellopsis sp. PD_5]|nr:hypothetical protein FQN50_000200 [Emmonsiellopsis sp. PD_5]
MPSTNVSSLPLMKVNLVKERKSSPASLNDKSHTLQMKRGYRGSLNIFVGVPTLKYFASSGMDLALKNPRRPFALWEGVDPDFKDSDDSI